MSKLLHPSRTSATDEIAEDVFEGDAPADKDETELMDRHGWKCRLVTKPDLPADEDGQLFNSLARSGWKCRIANHGDAVSD